MKNRLDTEKCYCCYKFKKDTKLQKVNTKFFNLCPECIESLKWTQACLRIGTEKLVSDMPNKWQRATKFSVTACE